MRKLLWITVSILCLIPACRSGTGPASEDLSEGVLERVLKGQGRIVDLTHPFSSSMPYWPGEGAKPFEFQVVATFEKDGYYAGAFTMPEHIGTHLDAPKHFKNGLASVDALSPRQLIGPAVVVDVREQVAQDPDYRLSVEDIKRWETAHGRLPSGSLVFMLTGWGARWTSTEAYRNQDENGVMHFPGYSVEAAEFLVTERDIQGLGIDTLSVDYGPSPDFGVHRITHGAGKYHIENAANLEEMPSYGAMVIVAPIPIEGGSGGPVRVFALVSHKD